MKFLIPGTLVVALLGGPALAEPPEKRITAWPLVYHASGPTEAETDVLWPLLRYERKDSYTRYAFRPFVFSTESDPARDFRETSVLWPVSIYRHEPDKDWFHVFPFYWDYDGPQSNWWHVWPIYGVYHRGPDYTQHSTLWPLFSYGSDSAGTDVNWSAPWPLIGYERRDEHISHHLLPLYWLTRAPGTSSGFVLPYFWSSAPDRTTRGLFPLWYSHDTPDHDTSLLVPFYLHDERPGRELTFITPLWMDRRTTDSRLRALLPLYVDYDAPTFGFEVGLPLYAHYRGAESSFTTVLPVYYHARDVLRDREFTYYFPFYGTYRRGDDVSRHYLLFPLYATFEDRELGAHGWDALWPLFHYEASPDTLDVRALPFYWASRTPEHDWTFAMLYGSMDSADRELSWFVPFYFRRQGDDSSLTAGSLALLPPYYLNYSKPGESTFHVWPFYGVDREGSYEERSVLWPLFRSGADEEGTRRRIQALLYYHGRQGQQSTTWLVPLWYHSAAPERVIDASPLLHWYQGEPERQHWAFLWLYPPEVALARRSSGPGYSSHGLFPLYGYERDEARDRLHWSALWPLLTYTAEGEAARKTEFLWKVFTYERADEQTSEYRLLWRFVRRSEAPGKSLFEFNPFYYHESEEGEGEYWNVLGGLFGKRTAADGTTDIQWLWFF